jgi:hypothetical protein
VTRNNNNNNLPRKDGRRGLTQMEGAYIAEVIKLEKYVEHKQNPLMLIVRTHQRNTNSTLFQITKTSRNLFRVTQSK